MKALRHEARSIGFRLKAGHRETVRATLARRDPMARAVIRSQQEGSTSSADPVRGLHARLNEEGNQVIEQLEADRALGDVERVPLNYPGGCEQYFSDKIATRYPDAWINWNEDCPGYRVPFQKIFARSPSSRSLEKVRSRTDEVVDELLLTAELDTSIP